MSNIALNVLIGISRYRWSVAILAALVDGGARFAEILHKVGLSRDSLSRNLNSLIENGWVTRNPGHGHPLRPEYLLTAEGLSLASRAMAVLKVQEQLGLDAKDMTRWILPLIHVLAGEKKRFNEIDRTLPEASPRALSISLKAMASLGLLERTIVDDYPPVTEYILSSNGQMLAGALAIA